MLNASTPDLPAGWSPAAVKPRRPSGGRAGRWRSIWPILVSLLIIIGGIEALGLGVVRLQDASRLADAPICTSREQAGCRLDEQVTVVDAYKDYSARGNPTQLVKVQTPDGSTQTVYASEHDAGLWSRLRASEAVKAELWNGYVIRLDDNAGHYLLADDSPAVTSVIFPIIGTVALIVGGAVLALSVRSMRRQRPATM